MIPWTPVDAIEVLLDFGAIGEVPMGMLATSGDQVFFEYAVSFIARGDLNPSPFQMNYSTELQPVGGPGPALGKLFADALPDGWTRTIIDRRVAEQGYDPATLGPLDRLALVGGNGVGALTFRPACDLPQGIPPLTLDDLAEIVAMEKGNDVEVLAIAEKLAGSLGGGRPKASVWLEGERIEPAPFEGGEHWLVKFPNPVTDGPDAGAIEYAYSLLARRAGITMAPTRLLTSGRGARYFATRRFDHHGDRRFHYQSFAGLNGLEPPAFSTYQELLEMDMALTGSAEPDEQLVRRMAFNVLARNRDDHIRNHGFLMNDQGIWVAAPAFDLTFEPIRSHQMLVGSEADDPGIGNIGDAVWSLGHDGDRAERIARNVRDAVATWPEVAADVGLDSDRIIEIDRRIKTSSAWHG